MVRWVDPTLQTKVTYRAGDTMICVPPKSGTTWTMNIFHQLVSKGDPDFEDIYAEVPWVEFKEGPDQSDEELLERWAKMASPRGFKTHSFPNTQPGGMMEYRDDLKYVVVVRNPEEALVSFKPFLQSFNPKLFDYWQVPELRELLHSFQDFPSFFEKYLLKGLPGMPAEAVPPRGADHHVLDRLHQRLVASQAQEERPDDSLQGHESGSRGQHEADRRLSRVLSDRARVGQSF